DDHQYDGNREGLDYFSDPLGHGSGCVQRDGVVHALRQSQLLFCKKFFDSTCRRHSVRARQLINRDDRTRLAVQVTDDGVVLRSELNASNVLYTDNSAIRRCAHHDLLKVLRRNQPALGPYGVGEFLAWRSRFAANLAGRIHRVLSLDRRDNFWNCDAELRQLVRLHPQSHRVPAGAKHLDAADAGHAAQLIVEVDVGIVSQEFRIIDAAGRVNADQHQRRGGRLLYCYSEVDYVCWKLRGGLCLANLSEDQIGVGISFYVVVDNQPHIAG